MVWGEWLENNAIIGFFMTKRTREATDSMDYEPAGKATKVSYLLSRF